MRILILLLSVSATLAQVPNNSSPPVCPGPYEILSSCQNPCESCDDLSGSDCTPPVNCQPGCNCITGYARDTNGVCIDELQCPCSDPNAIRVVCPSPCPRTCANLLTNGTLPCPRFCLSQGCTCKVGYVLNSAGNCVKPEQCPPLKCPAHEEYNACPALCSFDATCATYVLGLKILCVQVPNKGICSPRCQCKPGFVRIDGKCVSPSKCCTEPNNQLVDCPAPCEATCSSIPAPNCTVSCRARKCICDRGYVRSGPNCIRKKNCPCPDPNAVRKNCPNPCPPTCDNLEGEKPCTKACVVRGCTCKYGFVLNSAGVCVTPDQCPTECQASEESQECDSSC